MTASESELSFKYFPGGVLVYAGLAALILYGTYRILRDPDVISFLGIVLLVFTLLAGIYSAYAGALLWPISWRFRLTPSHLIATHEYRRARLEVPWETIVRVTKQPRPVFGPGRLRISQIETTDHRTILVGAHLHRYATFLEELKARAVNCRVFDPYLSETDR